MVCGIFVYIKFTVIFEHSAFAILPIGCHEEQTAECALVLLIVFNFPPTHHKILKHKTKHRQDGEQHD